MRPAVHHRTQEASTHAVADIETLSKATTDCNNVEIFNKLMKKAQEVAQSAF